MTRKSVSFDAVVHFFMKHYNIPSKRDIEKLMTKLDNIETLVIKSAARGKAIGSRNPGRHGMTASDTVLEIIKENGEDGVNFAEIQDKTGFEEKKIRNIVFRLNKLEKIKRKTRGIYVAT
jgi:acetaldehyde dehydrogenase (acetylating)